VNQLTLTALCICQLLWRLLEAQLQAQQINCNIHISLAQSVFENSASLFAQLRNETVSVNMLIADASERLSTHRSLLQIGSHNQTDSFTVTAAAATSVFKQNRLLWAHVEPNKVELLAVGL
jgi:hypothetical protein